MLYRFKHIFINDLTTEQFRLSSDVVNTAFSIADWYLLNVDTTVISPSLLNKSSTNHIPRHFEQLTSTLSEIFIHVYAIPFRVYIYVCYV